MPVEQGQLRVWDDAISLDKTPFLVVGLVNYSEAVVSFTKREDWRVMWRGKIATQSTHQIEVFSEVIDESR